MKKEKKKKKKRGIHLRKAVERKNKEWIVPPRSSSSRHVSFFLKSCSYQMLQQQNDTWVWCVINYTYKLFFFLFFKKKDLFLNKYYYPMPNCKISHTYFTYKKKFEHSLYFLKLYQFSVLFLLVHLPRHLLHRQYYVKLKRVWIKI